MKDGNFTEVTEVLGSFGLNRHEPLCLDIWARLLGKRIITIRRKNWLSNS